MINSQQKTNRPKGGAAWAVTMDSLTRLIEQAAATSIPCAIDTSDLAALGLSDPMAMQPIAELMDIAAAHGCVVSGPYAGPPGRGAYYLFARDKAA
jgi:hypothetical protein